MGLAERAWLARQWRGKVPRISLRFKHPHSDYCMLTYDGVAQTGVQAVDIHIGVSNRPVVRVSRIKWPPSSTEEPLEYVEEYEPEHLLLESPVALTGQQFGQWLESPPVPVP